MSCAVEALFLSAFFALVVLVVVFLVEVLVLVVSVCAEAIPKASTAASVKIIFFIIVVFYN